MASQSFRRTGIPTNAGGADASKSVGRYSSASRTGADTLGSVRRFATTPEVVAYHVSGHGSIPGDRLHHHLHVADARRFAREDD